MADNKRLAELKLRVDRLKQNNQNNQNLYDMFSRMEEEHRQSCLKEFENRKIENAQRHKAICDFRGLGII